MDAPVVLSEQFNLQRVCTHCHGESEWLYHQEFCHHSERIRYDDVYSKDTSVASLCTASIGEELPSEVDRPSRSAEPLPEAKQHDLEHKARN